MLAKDVMTKRVVTVSPHAPVPDIARLLLEHRISAVPVVDADGRLLGIVSEGDLIRRPEVGGPRPLGQLNVIVTDGVVHLWGLVDSAEQRRALQVVAGEITGVRAVEDHLGEVAPYLRGT